jgi:hypothetical protein
MTTLNITDYINSDFAVKYNKITRKLSVIKQDIEQSKDYKSFAKNINNLTKALIEQSKKPEEILARDSFCVRIERDLYATTDKDKAKCDTQLSENMQIIQHLKNVSDKQAYRQEVKAAGIDIPTFPLKDTCITIIDKRIQNLGKDANNTLVAPEVRQLYKARQANFASVKNIYKELQKEALFGKEKQSEQAANLKPPSMSKPSKDTDRER